MEHIVASGRHTSAAEVRVKAPHDSVKSHTVSFDPSLSINLLPWLDAIAAATGLSLEESILGSPRSLRCDSVY